MKKFLNYRNYGLALSLSHFLTLFFWNVFDSSYGLIDRLSHNLSNPWPFIPEFYQSWVQTNASVLVTVYVAISFLTPVLFLIEKVPFSMARFVFSLALLAKLSIYFSSYDFMGNYHYMANIVMLAYAIAPRSLQSFKIIIALFYFGAGLIKLNWEWLSGSALLRESFIHGYLLVAACTYVVLLEIVFIWGLFSEKRLYRYAVLLQLVAFHLFSWHIVGFYYPLTMLLIISVFLIPTENIQLQSFLKTPANAPMIIYAAFFLIAQAYPKVLNKNEALTAEGRMFSLNMLDAKAECLVSFEVRHQQGYLYLDNPKPYATRIRCDPLTWLNYGRNLCHANDSVLLKIISKKTSEEQYRTVVENLDVCKNQDLSYSLFKNDWVLDSNELTSKIGSLSPKSLSTWRYDAQRTGQFQTDLPLELSASFHSYPLQMGIHAAAKSSPQILSDGTVIVPSDSGIIWAFKGDNLLWKNYYPHSGYGFHSAPLIVDDKYALIGSYDGVLQLLDAATGQRIWATKIADALGASALVLGDSVYIGTEHLPNSSYVVQLDLFKGQILKRYGPFQGLTHASLASDKDLKTIFGSTNTGHVFAISLTEQQIQWEKELHQKIIATPLVTDKAVWLWSTTGTLTALNLELGQELKSLQFPSGGRASPSWDIRQHRILISSEDGVLRSVDAESGEVSWQRNTSPGQVSSGTFTRHDSSKTIYWDRCKENTFCALDAETGKSLKEYPLGGDYTSSPQFFGQKIVLTLDGPQGYWIFQSNK